MSDAGTTTTITAVAGGATYTMKITVPPGDPATLYSAARALNSRGTELDTFGTTIGTRCAGIRESAQWSGAAADGYSGVVNGISTVVKTQGTPYTNVAKAIDTYAHTLEWGQGQARTLVTTTQAAVKTATAATIQPLVTSTNQQAAHITTTVSQAADTAKTVVVSAADEEKHGWATVVKGNALWKWVESAHKAFDGLAGDAWLSMVRRGGEDYEKAGEQLGAVWKYVADLAHDADTTGNWDVVEEVYKAFRSKSGIDEISKLGIDGSTLARMLPGLKIAGYGLDGVAGAGDILTLVSPEDKGFMGGLDRTAAVGNLAGIGVGVGVETGLIATDGALSFVPGVGEVAVVGTGLYLAGDYFYHSNKTFHDVCDDVGHTTVTATKTVGHVVSSAWHAATSWL
jgi:hypothetical protein